jgi:DNA-directed RNA polymerase subunit RPC12/RpoP
VESNLEKRQAFQSAEEMLKRNDDTLLHFVALELRRCMEAVVYEKLWARKEWIPADIARTWQPPQALEALLAIEPNAEKSMTIAVAPETTPGVLAPGASFRVVGVDRRPQLSWLKKSYHKLGAVLHAQSPFAKAKPSPHKRREFLQEPLHDLEYFVQSDFTFTHANVVRFTCYSCKTEVTVNALVLDLGRGVECLRCGCKFSVEKNGDDFIFHPDLAKVPCLACGGTLDLPMHELTSGYRFSCQTCGCKLEVTDQVWQYRKSDVQEEE